MMMLGKRALRPFLVCGLLLLLWQGTAIFKNRTQQPQELLEDTQVLHIAPAVPAGQPSLRRETSNHRNS
jgi:hypothetical protein